MTANTNQPYVLKLVVGTPQQIKAINLTKSLAAIVGAVMVSNAGAGSGHIVIYWIA